MRGRSVTRTAWRVSAVTPNGGNCNIQALINGVSAGSSADDAGRASVLAGYAVVCERGAPGTPDYSSSAHAAGSGRGGDTLAAAMRVVLSVHDVDPNSPGTVALPATVLYDSILSTTPAFALYALANGNDLHAQIAYTRLQKIADVEVRSMIPGTIVSQQAAWEPCMTVASATCRRRASCTSTRRIRRRPTNKEPSTEYWVVPATGSTTIGSVRAKLQPQTIAAQVLTRDVADTNYVHVAGDQILGGVKTFAASPSVPTPQNPSDAANKGYVDSVGGGVNLSSPGPIGGTTPNSGNFTSVAGIALQSKLYPWVDITHPAYGAVGDAQLSTNCATTNGSATLTCTGGSFAR